jgi:hypothetical protein
LLALPSSSLKGWASKAFKMTYISQKKKKCHYNDNIEVQQKHGRIKYKENFNLISSKKI